jgi:hypothetical protein
MKRGYRLAAGDQHRDHDRIALFRQRHLPASARWFVQVSERCRAASWIELGHVALDSTKTDANASEHKAVNYEITSGNRRAGLCTNPRGMGLSALLVSQACQGGCKVGPDGVDPQPARAVADAGVSVDTGRDARAKQCPPNSAHDRAPQRSVPLHPAREGALP